MNTVNSINPSLLYRKVLVKGVASWMVTLLLSSVGVAARAQEEEIPTSSNFYWDQERPPIESYATSDFSTLSTSTFYATPEIYSFQARDHETGLKFGHWKLHGILGLVTTYDSNALYTDTNKKNDFVYQVIPGVDLLYGSQKFNLVTGYRFTFRDNLLNNNQDDRQHRASINANVLPSRRYVFGVKDDVTFTSDPADAELPERIHRFTNDAGFEFRIKSPAEDFDIGLQYTNTYQKYDNQLANLGFYNNKVSLTSRYNISSRFQFLPKSVASLGIEFGQTTFKNPTGVSVTNSDSKGISVTGGLSSQVTRKTAIALNVGTSLIYFDVGPDSKTVTGGIGLKFQPARNLSFQADYNRATQVSTFTNYHTDHLFGFESQWKFAEAWRHYTKFKLGLLKFSGPNTLLNGLDRKDTVIQGITGIGWNIRKWLTTRLEYAADFRNSNATDITTGVQTADFLKHRVNASVDLYF